MGLRKSALSFLLVRESESKLVWRLFTFEFFQGAAIAIVFTTAITLFLQQLPIYDLPRVFVLSAFLLWLAAFIYNKLEHRFSGIQMVLVVLLFNMASVLTFLLFIRLETQAWFLFLFLASFNILYLLNNLEFWGLAAILFDVRQSKRLFSVVSASDLPAKLFGYLLTLLLVPKIGSENLLWIALGCMLISLILYRPLTQLPEIKNLNHHAHTPGHATHSVKAIQAAITGNKLIRILAIVSFFSLCCLLVVNVILYGYIKHEFKSDKQMQGFFAIFLGTVRFITLFIKVGVTNRLVDRIGLKRSLLITPIALIVLCLAAIYLSVYGHSYKPAFYLFGIMALATDVLCAAVQLPVILAAMQPLPTHQRLKGHTLLKGFMDPFAYLAMGIVLWIVTAVEQEPVPAVFGIILLVLIICWILTATRVDKYYSTALTAAIRDNSLNGRFISITDKESTELLLDKLTTGQDVQSISVLNLVSTQDTDITDFIEAGLRHSSPAVRLQAIRLTKEKHATGLLPDLLALRETETNPGLLAELLDTIVVIDPAQDFSSLIHHPDLQVAQPAVCTTLLQNSAAGAQAERKLEEWFQSGDQQQLSTALEVAGKTKISKYLPHIGKALQHPDPAIQSVAIAAAGQYGDRGQVGTLFNRFIEEERANPALAAALVDADQTSIEYIQDYLLGTKCEGATARKLISLLGKFPQEKATLLLEECLEKFPAKAKMIIPVLSQRVNRQPGKEDLYKSILKEDLQGAAHLLYSLHFLKKKNSDGSLLADALELELTDIRNNCFYLFSLLFDAEKMKRAKTGFDLNTKDSVANALELIQVAVPKEFATLFLLIFEKTNIDDKIGGLQKILKEPMLTESSIIKNIMFDVDYNYNHWTKSCVLYSLKGQPLPFNKEFIRPYAQAENRVLKQMAQIVLSAN